MKFGHFTILVHDSDAARNFYIEKLGFILEADRTLPGGYRWLSLVSPDDRNVSGPLSVQNASEGR